MKRTRDKIIKLNQAVILAGGRGERLRPLTDKVPKPMIPINEIPFLDYLINSLIQVGIKRFLILTGYKGKAIINRYGNLLNGGIEIGYSIGVVEEQTGRRLLNAYRLLDDYFLLLYGDNYWPIELQKMLNLYKEKNVKVLTTVFSNNNGTGEYGYENNIDVGEDNFVRGYDKQGRSSTMNGVDIGYFIVNKNSVDSDTKDNISFEEDILPGLISEKQLIAYVTDTQYYYITDNESLINFESVVIEKNIKPIPKSLFRKRIAK